jgi:pimeloyl-ACP methyl ester carboxylesterase
MKWRIFEPKTNSHLKSLVIMPNSLGGTLDGAAGRNAQAVANQVGIRVLGLERTTALHYYFYPWLRTQLKPHNYHDRAASIAQSIADHLDPNITQLIIAGHSAGGLDAAMLAVSNKLPVTHLIITDPPGMQKLSISTGRRRFRNYNRKYERNRLPDDVDFITDPRQSADSRWRGFQHTISEILLYSQIWSSDVTQQALLELIIKPELSILIHFAEYSFNGTPAQQTASAEQLIQLRKELGKDGQLSDIAMIPHSRHSTFNSATYRSDAILSLLALN